MRVRASRRSAAEIALFALAGPATLSEGSASDTSTERRQSRATIRRVFSTSETLSSSKALRR